MSRIDVIRIGPLNIPLPWLTFALFVLVGYMLVLFVFRRRREARRRITDIGSNALLYFFLAWKLSPLISSPSLIIRSPLSVLYLPGGILGLAAGIVAAALAVVYGVLRTTSGGRAVSARGVGLWAAVVLVGAGSVWLALPAAPRLVGGDSSVRTVGNRVGNIAPAVTLAAIDGRVVTLPGKGIVVLNFWATWCPPCRGELPEIAAFARSKSAATLYAINLTSTEKDPGGVASFLKSTGAGALTSSVLLDVHGTAAAAYGVKSIPTTVVIREGQIISVHPGVVNESWLAEVAGNRQ